LGLAITNYISKKKTFAMIPIQRRPGQKRRTWGKADVYKEEGPAVPLGIFQNTVEDGKGGNPWLISRRKILVSHVRVDGLAKRPTRGKKGGSYARLVKVKCKSKNLLEGGKGDCHQNRWPASKGS